MLELRTFGGLSLQADGASVTGAASQRKTLALLALLAASGRNGLSRDKVIAYHRWDQGGAGDDVVVVANFSGRAFSAYDIGFPRGGTWRVRFNGDSTAYDDGFLDTPSDDTDAQGGGRDGLGFHGTIGVGPYSVVILSQDD